MGGFGDVVLKFLGCVRSGFVCMLMSFCLVSVSVSLIVGYGWGKGWVLECGLWIGCI